MRVPVEGDDMEAKTKMNTVTILNGVVIRSTC